MEFLDKNGREIARQEYVNEVTSLYHVFVSDLQKLAEENPDEEVAGICVGIDRASALTSLGIGLSDRSVFSFFNFDRPMTAKQFVDAFEMKEHSLHVLLYKLLFHSIMCNRVPDERRTTLAFGVIKDDSTEALDAVHYVLGKYIAA